MYRSVLAKWLIVTIHTQCQQSPAHFGIRTSTSGTMVLVELLHCVG